MKRINLDLPKVNIVTDFVYGKAIYKLPNSFKKKIKKIANIYEFNKKNIPINKVNIYWGTRIKDTDLDIYKNLSWIHFGSVGTDKLSYNNLKDKKIKITNSKKTNSYSVAELVIQFYLDTKKQILLTKNFSDRTTYEKNYRGIIYNKKENILILGYGNISKKVIQILKQFNVKIDIYSSRNKQFKNKNIISIKETKKKLKQYDTIINILPNNLINKNLLNNNFFLNAINLKNFISVGRKETINIEHLYYFAKKNKNKFFYLDAQLDNTSIKKFKRLKNMVITPHIGGYYSKYWDDQFEIFKDNLLRYLNGKKLKNTVKIDRKNFK